MGGEGDISLEFGFKSTPRIQLWITYLNPKIDFG